MNKEDHLIEHTSTTWGTKTLITVFASVVVATNAFNRYVSVLEQNSLQIQYEKERSDKKDARVLEQAETLILINNYEVETERLERELKECKQ